MCVYVHVGQGICIKKPSNHKSDYLGPRFVTCHIIQVYSLLHLAIR